MSLKQINHVGIAVRSIDAALPYYENALGLSCSRRETVESQQVKVAFLPIGEVTLELLEPTSPESPIAKFIEKNGEGIHHIAFQTDGIDRQLTQAANAGVRLVHDHPFTGAHGMQVAFLHPKSTFGVLTEFCQPASTAPPADASEPAKSDL